MKLKVLDLSPTQMAVGMREVDHKVKKLKQMKDKELHEYLEAHPVPIVIGPKSRFYLIDHHHLTRACWEAGVSEVHTEKKADLSHLSFADLWKVMHDSHWIFTYDQLGNGPHNPIHLPENVKGLADDPFRSLAWQVRENGGYVKSEIPFAEFHWASFFRKHMKAHPLFDQAEHTLKEALELCKSTLAKHLPGFNGR